MMRSLLLLLLLPLFLSLSGCFRCSSRSCAYDVVQTDLCERVEEGFESGAVCEGEYPSEQWWTFFQDPQLDRLIETSLSCHPDILIAQARVNRAYNVAKEKRSALLPHFFLLGTIYRQKVSQFGGLVPGEPELFTEGILQVASSFYELDLWQKNRNRVRAALDEMWAEMADYKEVELVLSTAIAGAYFDLQMNLVRRQLYEERLVARQEVYSLLEQQFQMGVISEFHLYETDTEVQVIKDMLYIIEAVIESDKHALAALAGNLDCCGGELCAAPAAVFETPFPLPTTLPLDLIARRPDITAQKWRIEGACMSTKVAKAEFFPMIDLFGFLGYQSFKFSEFFKSSTLSLLGDALGILPIFTAGNLTAKLGVAQEDLEIAIEEYNQLILQAVQEVSDSLTGLISADKRTEALKVAIADAQGLYRLTRLRYENGIANKIAVLNALENILKQKDLEIQAELARYESAVQLVAAIGGGYCE